MELTKEHFEKVVKNFAEKDDLKSLASKEDLQKTILAAEKRIINRIDDAQEELAIMAKNGFEDVLDRLDVTERMQKLETEMAKIKTALHLS
jgi:predicted amino acid dehydrogenase